MNVPNETPVEQMFCGFQVWIKKLALTHLLIHFLVVSDTVPSEVDRILTYSILCKVSAITRDAAWMSDPLARSVAASKNGACLYKPYSIYECIIA